MTESPLVSIIMPAYNAAAFVRVAIESVINQSYQNWELLVVNDGSQDQTEQIVQENEDSRIRYFKQENQGVSAARNRALAEMRGDFFCFLDADDAFTPTSITSRITYFVDHPDVNFVDGTILLKDENLNKTIEIRKMSFSGNPRDALVRLDQRCFFGPSWMIRRDPAIRYAFSTSMTHVEDLLFCYSISKTGYYAAIEDEILLYRVSPNSAMSNLQGIENGYASFYSEIEKNGEAAHSSLHYLKKRITRIMFLSYVRRFKLLQAITVVWRFTRL